MSKQVRAAKLEIEQLQILSEHCKGIRIAINAAGSILGYIPCAKCTHDWCGEHSIIEVPTRGPRKTQIELFRKSFDRAREAGMIPLPVEDDVHLRMNVVPIRRGA